MEILDLANDGVMIRTMEGRINSWNHGAVKLYGWRKEEAIEKTSHDLLQTQFPKPLEEIESELVRNGRWEGKLVHTTRDGGHVVVDSRWTFDMAGQSRSVVEVNSLSTGRAAAPEARIYTGSPGIGRQGSLSTSKSIKTADLLPKVANIVLVGGAVLSILVLVFYIYYYVWTQQRQSATTMSVVLQYILPTALSTFLLVSLRFKAAHKVNLALVCLSIIAAVYVMELFLVSTGSSFVRPRKPVMAHLSESPDKKNAAAKLRKEFGANIDIRSAGEVIADLSKNGENVVPFISPSNNLFVKQPDNSIKSALTVNGREFIPLAGISNKLTILCNESGQWVSFKSDKHGFNNPNEMWQPNRVQIAALGDSFTQGYCVPTDKSFVGLIRQRYPATLNLGISGDGPLLMLATLNEYLLSVRPKVVLWFYYEGNDLTDLQGEMNSALVRHYLSGDFSQDLQARQNDVDRAIVDDFARHEELEKRNQMRKRENHASVADRVWQIVKLSALRHRLGLVGGISSEELQTAWALQNPMIDLFHEILWQAKNRVNGWGGKLYFVYLPTWHRFADSPNFANNLRKEVLDIVTRLDIPVIDIKPVFQAHGGPLSLFPFRAPGHYNEAGHGIVAAEVLRSLDSGK